MPRTRPLLLAASAAAAFGLLTVVAGSAAADGAYSIETQFEFQTIPNVSIVSPFVDGDGVPWVLANRVEDTDNNGLIDEGVCRFYGPFDRNDPLNVDYVLPDVDLRDTPITQCTSVQPGPDGGFFVRGFWINDGIQSNEPLDCGDQVCDGLELPGQASQCPADCGPLGFIVFLDSNFEALWGPTFDIEQEHLGRYNRPLSSFAWSESRDRVLMFFETVLDLGADTIPQLHGVSIADGNGQVRRVIQDWGNVGDGLLEGVLVAPDDGRFLVVAHSNGSEFLLYNGLESIEAFPGGGIAWQDEDILYVQYGANDSLYVMHHDRLDLSGLATSMTRMTSDGLTAFYTRSIDRTVEVTVPESPDPIELTLRRPVLAYVTDTTFTFVRQVGNSEFAFHVYDNFNGAELAIQPISTVDDAGPTHIADAQQPDRLILMTAEPGASSTRRWVNTIVWDPNAETPGGLGGGEGGGDDVGFPDAGGDAGGNDGGGGGGDGGNGGDGGGDSGCCQAATSSGAQDPWLALVAIALFAVNRRRRGSRSA